MFLKQALIGSSSAIVVASHERDGSLRVAEIYDRIPRPDGAQYNRALAPLLRGGSCLAQKTAGN